jgi:hypothetical protein
MFLVSLPAAITLTGWSERTFWRRFAEGALERQTVKGGSVVRFAVIKPHLCIPLAIDDFAVLESAEAGSAEAQNDLALIFLANGKPKGAHYWLELAARQGYTDAMNLLGRCYLGAEGVAKDENIGMMWISKAAALGHLISQGQMQGMRDMIFQKSSKE